MYTSQHHTGKYQHSTAPSVLRQHRRYGRGSYSAWVMAVNAGARTCGCLAIQHAQHISCPATTQVRGFEGATAFADESLTRTRCQFSQQMRIGPFAR